MRHYPSDSPEAMTRVVALALLADGAIDPSELEVLKGSSYCFRIGIDPCRFEQIVDEFCDDLLACGKRKPTGQYDLSDECVRDLLGDINSPKLRELALGMMLDIISSDGVLVREETSLIAQVIDCWKLGYRAIGTKRGVEAPRDNWQAQYRRAESRL